MHVEVAYQIYERSAKLVAASIAGLAMNLHDANPAVKTIQVLAEGSLFWSQIITRRSSYAELVNTHVAELVKKAGHAGDYSDHFPNGKCKSHWCCHGCFILKVDHNSTGNSGRIPFRI